MINYKIEISTKEEVNIVDKGILTYNKNQVPFTQEPFFYSIDRVIKGPNGEVIAGLNSEMYCWNCLFIQELWVKDEYRKSGLGSALLIEVEKIAKEKGCELIHLDIFDFQAKDFYLKHDYEIFGILENCPAGHNRYYMRKILS